MHSWVSTWRCSKCSQCEHGFEGEMCFKLWLLTTTDTHVNQSGGRDGVGLRRNGVMTFCHQTSFPHNNYLQSLLLTEGWKGERGGDWNTCEKIGLDSSLELQSHFGWFEETKLKHHLPSPQSNTGSMEYITAPTNNNNNNNSYWCHSVCTMNQASDMQTQLIPVGQSVLFRHARSLFGRREK